MPSSENDHAIAHLVVIPARTRIKANCNQLSTSRASGGRGVAQIGDALANQLVGTNNNKDSCVCGGFTLHKLCCAHVWYASLAQFRNQVLEAILATYLRTKVQLKRREAMQAEVVAM